jgi:EAL domain-containing protein (putative c-di-GMP-specific phosphodiesterase class I)
MGDKSYFSAKYQELEVTIQKIDSGVTTGLEVESMLLVNLKSIGTYKR